MCCIKRRGTGRKRREGIVDISANTSRRIGRKRREAIDDISANPATSRRVTFSRSRDDKHAIALAHNKKECHQASHEECSNYCTDCTHFYCVTVIIIIDASTQHNAQYTRCNHHYNSQDVIAVVMEYFSEATKRNVFFIIGQIIPGSTFGSTVCKQMEGA